MLMERSPSQPREINVSFIQRFAVGIAQLVQQHLTNMPRNCMHDHRPLPNVEQSIADLFNPATVSLLFPDFHTLQYPSLPLSSPI